MSADGAHLNLGADDAMRKIVGGVEPPAPMAFDVFCARIRAAVDVPTDYGGTSESVAKYLLRYLEEHPEHRDLPLDDVYDWEAWRATSMQEHPPKVGDGVWSLAKAAYPEMKTVAEGITGFMAGWAFNAARHCLGLGPVSNPAIVEISTG
jgi:hypothetical protein